MDSSSSPHPGAYLRDVVDITELTKQDFITIFEHAREIERKKLHKSKWCLLENKTVILGFFEPSTRTRISFEEAAYRLCAHTISIVGEEATSMAKGESFRDTIKIFDIIGDLLVIRHPREGAAKYAAEVAENPVINAGDGKNQHPTQTLIDFYVIWKKKGDLSSLSYAVVGDLRYARTARSFLLGLTRFKPRSVYLVAPPLLRPPNSFLEELRTMGLKVFEAEKLEDVISSVDVLYVTRIQKERFPDPSEYEKVKGSYRVTKTLLSRAREGLMVLHPLPRLDELETAVDETPYAAYFDQVRSSVPVRMSVLAWSAGVIP